jgi:HEAT repeat protein
MTWFFLLKPKITALVKQHDVKALVKALSYRMSIKVRAEAAEALGDMGVPEAVEPLVRALTDSMPVVRAMAARSLGKLRANAACKQLRSCLTDQDETTRCNAIQALVDIGDKGAMPQIAQLIMDPSKEVRKMVLEALHRLGDASLLDHVLPALSAADADICIAGARALSKLGDQRATGPLLTRLSDPNKRIRSSCIHALGELRDEHAIAPLLGLLKDEDQTPVQKAVYYALSKICKDREARTLLPLLRDERIWIRGVSARILEHSGWQPGKDEDSAWFWLAKGDIDHCLDVGLPATPALLSDLRHPDSDMRNRAALILGKIGSTTAIEPLRGLLFDEQTAEAAFRALADLGYDINVADVPVLLSALSHPNVGVRIKAALALGKIGDKQAVEPLRTLLGHEETLYPAIWALGRLGIHLSESEKRAWTLVTKGYIRSCAAIGPPAVPALLTVLSHTSPKVRSEAALSLGEIGDKRAVEPLKRLLSDKVASPAAMQALWMLGANIAQEKKTVWPLGFFASMPSGQQVKNSAIVLEGANIAQEKKTVWPLGFFASMPSGQQVKNSAIVLEWEEDIEDLVANYRCGGCGDHFELVRKHGITVAGKTYLVAECVCRRCKQRTYVATSPHRILRHWIE